MKALLSFALAAVILFPASLAFAVANSIVCTINKVPSDVPQTLRATIYVDNLSSQKPLVALYGHQVMPLEKKVDAQFIELSSLSSRFYFKIDTDRNRVLVAPKAAGQNKPEPVTEGGWVAGNCESI